MSWDFMPLTGAELPEPCRLEERQEQSVAAFPFSSPASASVSESIALLGQCSLGENV